jgi:prevent-host-death family protein
MKTISAAQANREFSKLLAGVQKGEHFTVVSRGTPVATMGPATSGTIQRLAAHKALLTRLKAQGASSSRASQRLKRGWTRDELYADR